MNGWKHRGKENLAPEDWYDRIVRGQLLRGMESRGKEVILG